MLVATGVKCRWRGSMPEHKTYKHKRQAADTKFHQDYFIERPLYNEDHFRRRCCPNNSLVILLWVLTCNELQLHFCTFGRFRMRKSLFLKIVDDLKAANPFFAMILFLRFVLIEILMQSFVVSTMTLIHTCRHEHPSMQQHL
jgi:hypothetical protein